MATTRPRPLASAGGDSRLQLRERILRKWRALQGRLSSKPACSASSVGARWPGNSVFGHETPAPPLRTTVQRHRQRCSP